MGIEDSNEPTKELIKTNDNITNVSNVDHFDDELSSVNKDVLPLNSSVLQRIRLNISTGLPNTTTLCRQEAIVCIEAEGQEEATVTVRQNNGTVLQKSMRQKLANVLQSDSQISHQKCQNSIQSEHPVIDMSSLRDQWLALDSHFRLMDQKVKKNSKKNCISFESDLWISFNEKMNQMRELLDPLNSLKRCADKRSTQQTDRKALIVNKKIKHFI